MPVAANSRIRLLLLGGIVVLCWGCATVEEMAPKPAAPAPALLPAEAKAVIRYLEGPYAALFAPESAALWEASPNGLRITCVSSSAFNDTSIAYDMAGLRNVRCYLELPDGTIIPPASINIGSDLIEKQQFALTQFTRVNRLHFPVQVIPRATVGTRLILESHDTRFAFTWPAASPAAVKE